MTQPRKPPPLQLGMGSLIAFDVSPGLVLYNKPLAMALYYAPIVLCFVYFGIAALLRNR